MNIGDIVIFKSYYDWDIGHYGKIIDNRFPYKVTVEVAARVGDVGSLAVTAKRNDLEVVGVSK